VTDLFVLGVFGLVADSSVKGEQKTDTVCLDLKTLKYGSEKGTRGLGWYVSQRRVLRKLIDLLHSMR
jgi:hypothetical protein